MPFDGTGFLPERQPQRRPAKPGDNAISLIIIALAFSLLVMPISLTALVDIVRYFRHL